MCTLSFTDDHIRFWHLSYAIYLRCFDTIYRLLHDTNKHQRTSMQKYGNECKRLCALPMCIEWSLCRWNGWSQAISNLKLNKCKQQILKNELVYIIAVWKYSLNSCVSESWYFSCSLSFLLLVQNILDITNCSRIFYFKLWFTFAIELDQIVCHINCGLNDCN